MAEKPAASLTPAVYAWNLDHIQCCANLAGYAIAVHGTMARDFDLVAVPWVEDVETPDNLVDLLCQRFRRSRRNDLIASRARHRLTWRSLFLYFRFIGGFILP